MQIIFVFLKIKSRKNGSKVVQYEKFIGKDSVDVLINRSGGFYGLVHVDIQILDCHPESLPIAPRNIKVVLDSFITERNASFKIPDELPDRNVSCLIKIAKVTTLDPSYNATLNFPKVDQNNNEVTVNIYSGDAFVRFSKASYYAQVEILMSTVQLTVFRGVHSKNASLVVGSTKLPATVKYYLVSQTAQYGIDFIADNSSLGFGPGISSVSLSVSIVPGNSPEKSRYFQIILNETTGNIVLSEPHVADIILTGGSEIHGILSWGIIDAPDGTMPSVGIKRFLVGFSSDVSNNIVVWSLRRGGTLGFVSVQWEVLTNRSENRAGANDKIGLRPVLGLLVFRDGETFVSLNFTVVKGLTLEPRPLKLYKLRMLPETVTGGAKVMLNESAFYLLDKDCGIAYGMFELNRTSSAFVVNQHSRALRIGIFRRFGLYEDVLVDLQVQHSELGLIFNGTTFTQDGEGEVLVDVQLSREVFIKRSSIFYILISNSRLFEELPFGPYNSPLIGNASLINMSLPGDAANGIIRFNYLQLNVQIESNALSKLIEVPLMRDGSFGSVMITWRTIGLEVVTAWNVSVLTTPGGRYDNFTGMTRLETGQFRASIPISFEKYNVTSFSERFDIKIVRLEPRSVAKLEESGSTCSIILPELGNLAGYFKFCSWMANSFVVSVEKESIEVCISRSGDILVDASILFSLEPNGDAKFYGGRTVLYFSRGEAMKKITVMARNDGVPQLNLTYTLKLSSFGTRVAGIDASRNITVTVLPHSYPFGVVEFLYANLTETIVLRNNRTSYSAMLRVRRFKGGFSRASVMWAMMTMVDRNDEIRFQSGQGVVTFELHQPDLFIGVNFAASNMPRYNKRFVIRLINSTNGSILGENLEAAIRIVGYDYSIRFNDSFVHLASPGQYEVPIVRDGPLANESSVKCRTSPRTALVGRDFVGIDNESLVFAPGVSSKILNITVLDDLNPRPDRIFHVLFYNVEGGIVATNNLTVVVLAKHNSNGVFKFTPTFNKTTTKGSTVSFQILRERGFYGNSTVFYGIHSSDCNSSIDGRGYFSATGGRVAFEDRQTLANLGLNVLQNDIPELYLGFCVSLTGVSGGPSYDPAILDAQDLQVFLTILPSNFPFGKIHFGSSSRQVSIAEDVDNSTSVSNEAKLLVSRSKGAADYQRDLLEEIVSWEVYSYQITSALTFPTAIDLVLLATKAIRTRVGVTRGVSSADDQRRDGTGTNVLRFDGCDGCFVSMTSNKNISSDSSVDFSTSFWVKSFSKGDSLSGCILSKSSNKMLEYAVCIKSTNQISSSLLFYYSTKLQQSSQSTVDLGKSISDDRWHFVVVQFSNSSMFIQLDNVPVQQSLLPDMKFISMAGEYLVGGMDSNQFNFFGLMQDLKIYGQKLNDLLLQELYLLPARKDINVVSGYLIFNGTKDHEMIFFKSIDNSIPEPNKVFTVRLIDCSGPSDVSTNEDISILTILKSDNSNGLFGLSDSCTNSIRDLDTSLITCPILRYRGTFSTVTVAWKVEGNSVNNDDPDNSIGSNFLMTSGSVVFDPGVIQKNITLSLIDDWLPKLRQSYRIVLTSATSSDGLVGSTWMSGASISLTSSSTAIQIRERNFPYGFFQLSDSLIKTGGNETFLRAMLEPQVIEIVEDVKVLVVYVVRHQGMTGRASVEWRTMQGRARSKETSPEYDFDSSAGLLQFASGEIVKTINISIYQPKTIKPDREFKVQLNNSQPLIGSGCGPEMTVTISASRKAFGVFGFDRNSLKVSVSKDSVKINDTAVTRFVIQREVGFLGFVTLSWNLSCPFSSNFTLDLDSFGTLTFSPSQTSSQLLFNVTNDGVPSLTSTCFLKLLTSSEGAIDESRSIATMVMMASNDPYGRFVIGAPSRFIRVESTNQNVLITIERMFGVYGEVKVTHSTLTPEEFYPHLPAGVTRATKDDFDQMLGEVVFARGQRWGYFNMTIKRNVLPSLDASVFLRLMSVSLLRSEQIDPVQNSPRLGNSTECLVQIEIDSHDFPHGVLQLSSRAVKVPQNFSSSLGYVVRSAGSAGQVSIRIEVVPDTAQSGINFVVSSRVVIFENGITVQSLPISVVNTLAPQPQLQFSIRLLNESVTGGAVVGDADEMLVVIEESWDISGVFGFDEISSSLMEKDLKTSLTCHLLITRSRGSRGVVSIYWTTNSSVYARVSSPPHGLIFFLSSEMRSLLNLEFEPRNVDDPVREIVVELVNASNGGHLDATRSRHKIRVVPSFNPYGEILFGSLSFMLNRTSPENNVPILRVNGTQGTLRVYYSLRSFSLDDVVEAQNKSILTYFKSPVTGLFLSDANSTLVADVALKTPSIEACARLCLYNFSCAAFAYNTVSLDCLSSSNSTELALDRNSTIFVYAKNVSHIQDTLNVLAREDEDFEAATNSSFIFPEGSTQHPLGVKIFLTKIPKLEQGFSVMLTAVELVDGDVGNPNFYPRLGWKRSCELRIALSNDPRGVFTIYHWTSGMNISLMSNQSRYIVVEQRPDYSVLLAVERRAGLLGTVSVDWFVDVGRSTAFNGVQFSANGATLTFAPSVMRQTISIGMLKYDSPSDDRSIVVGLRNPQGGARIAEGDEGSVVIIVAAHDFVAGIVAFREEADVTEEGNVKGIALVRSAPGLGTVIVFWSIEPRYSNQTSPEQRFLSVHGSLSFQPGELSKVLFLNVTLVRRPEVDDVYLVRLRNVTTVGIRLSGEAAIDANRKTFLLTIKGGNNPHGVFSFLESSRKVTVEASNVTLELEVRREFGLIGDIHLIYSILSGFIPSNDESSIPALANVSFVEVKRGLATCRQGSNSTNISMTLLNDGRSRPKEVISVTLTSVELASSSSSPYQPTLAPSGTSAQVIILEREGAYGVAIFRQEFVMVTVSSLIGTLTMEVFRDRGLYRNVSVFCFAQPLPGGAGAISGVDYNFNSRILSFERGVDRRIVTVEILTSDFPKPEKSFQLVLSNPTDGLILGVNSRATITILANGQMAGSVAFQTSENVTMKPSSLPYLTSVFLPLFRGSGTSGVINVPYVVSPISQQGAVGTLRIQPLSGVVTFRDKQNLNWLSLRVLPEVIDSTAADEMYRVDLLPPDGGAVLSSPTKKFVQVFRKGSPFGLVQVYFSQSVLRRKSFQSSELHIELNITRTIGTRSKVLVDVSTTLTISSTEISRKKFGLAFFQYINGGSPSWKWYQYNAHGSSYAMSFEGGGELFIYRWQGSFVFVQSLEMEFPVAVHHANISGKIYLFVVNGGMSIESPTKSGLYEVLMSGRVLLVQEIPTISASDAIVISPSSSSPATTLLLILSYRDRNSRTTTVSKVYSWNADVMQFTTLSQNIATRGARHVAMFKRKSIENGTILTEGVYVVVTNHFDSDYDTHNVESVVYSLGIDGQLVTQQNIRLLAADVLIIFDDVKFSSSSTFIPSSSSESNVFAVFLHDFNRSVSLYIWDLATNQFAFFQKILFDDIVMVSAVAHPETFEKLLMVAGRNKSFVYQLDKSIPENVPVKFVQIWEYDSFLTPLMIPQSSVVLTFVVSRLESPDSKNCSASMALLASFGANDVLFPSHLTVSFEEGQTSQNAFISIIGGQVRDRRSTFNLTLINPRFGVEVGNNFTLEVVVDPNASIDGVFQFTEDSMSKDIIRFQNQSSSCLLRVQRSQGTRGTYTLSWKIEAAEDVKALFIASMGRLEFPDGRTETSFNLILTSGPELYFDVNLSVVLHDLTSTRGSDVDPDVSFSLPARLGLNVASRVKIKAREAIHGVFGWESGNFSISEAQLVASSAISLSIIRHQGALGRVKVFYATSEDPSVPPSSRARAWSDFIPVNSSVAFENGMRRSLVNITILKNPEPELTEVFVVRLLSLELLPDISGPQQIGVLGPSLDPHSSTLVTRVHVWEHGNPRGVVQFSVHRNEEGRVDVDEGDPIDLLVTRSSSLLGNLNIDWISHFVTSSSSLPPPQSDLIRHLQPQSGSVSFMEGQTQTHISLKTMKVDDNFSFRVVDVLLSGSRPGGGSLGEDDVCRVGIRSTLANSSLVFISPEQVELRRSKHPSDPEGRAVLSLMRVGVLRNVSIEWRLDAVGRNKFLPPHYGEVVFKVGDAVKQLKLQSSMSAESRGREVIRLFLVGVTEGSILSPSSRSSSLVLLPNVDILGHAAINATSKSIMILRPRLESGDGRLEIGLTRVGGFCGELKVAWKILPSGKTDGIFFRESGEVVMADFQTRTTVDLIVLESLEPNILMEFMFQVTSAVSSRTDSSVILLLPSNYPYGWFSFETPSSVTINRSLQSHVPIKVVRKFGTTGSAKVFYEIINVNATSSLVGDEGSLDWLPFEDGTSQKFMSVRLRNLTTPVGLSIFLVNLTRVELMFANPNEGLASLDSLVTIGFPRLFTILVSPDPNAGGTIQFKSTRVSVYRDFGLVSLPITRGPGTYGDVMVHYATTGVSSRPGDDFYPDEGWVVIRGGGTEAAINISLVDDGRIKPSSQFIVRIVGVSDPLTALGSDVDCLITIEKSGYPYGKFGFIGPRSINLPNLDIASSVTLSIQRTVSLAADQQVSWQVYDHKTGDLLNDTSDLTLAGVDIERLSSSLVWKDGEGGRKSFSLLLKPHVTWELEKQFVMRITSVESQAPDRSGSVDPLNSEVLLIMDKFGHMNGLLRFESTARNFFDEPQTDQTIIQFAVIRTLGTYGDIEVGWMLLGSEGTSKDFGPTSGSVAMKEGQSLARIELSLLQDDEDEFDESYTLSLMRSSGGADIDQNFSTVSFVVRGHGHPCGLFLLNPALQKFVTSVNPPSRKVVLNVTRTKGSSKGVLTRLSLNYDQAANSLLYTNSKEFTVLVADQSRWISSEIDVNLDAFISSRSYFTACLVSLTVLDGNVSIQPLIDPTMKCSKIPIPAEAGNTEVGFQTQSALVNYENQSSKVAIQRFGSFGSVQIDWSVQRGRSPVPFESFVLSDLVTPTSGTVSMVHGQSLAYFEVKINPITNRREMFSLTLQRFASEHPVQFLPQANLTCILQPDGIISISDKQLNLTISLENNADPTVTLNLERSFGSLTEVEVWYSAYSSSIDSIKRPDHRDIQYGKVSLSIGQIAAFLTIKLNPYLSADECLIVNLTLARRTSGSAYEGSYPQLAFNQSESQISLRNAFSSYGVFSIKIATDQPIDWFSAQKIPFIVSRTGSTVGSALVNVRTAGGGEPWDAMFGKFLAPDNDTIAALLSKRDYGRRSYVGADYQMLDVTLNFMEGEKEHFVNVFGLSFDRQEAVDEEIFVYLRALTAGLRVARSSIDDGLKGYSMVKIQFDSRWKEVVGFVKNSTTLIGDEDMGIIDLLMIIDRINGTLYPERIISWQAVQGTASPLDVLQQTLGSFKCSAGKRVCSSHLFLKDDNISRNKSWITIELSLNQQDAKSATIDDARRYCNVTLKENDFPNGLVEFALESRNIFVSQTERECQVTLDRSGFLNKMVTVTYDILSLPVPTVIAGIIVLPAVEGIHYSRMSGIVTFPSGVSIQKLAVQLKTVSVQKLESPVRFTVHLTAASYGCVLGEALSNITITNSGEYPVWNLWSQAMLTRNNESIVGTSHDLNDLVKSMNFSRPMVVVASQIIRYISSSFAVYSLTSEVKTSIMDVLCSAMEADRQDSFLGFLPLTETLGIFAASLLQPVSSCDNEFISSDFFPCPLVMFAIRQSRIKDINSLQWNQFGSSESLTTTLNTALEFSSSNQCIKVLLVIYKSLLWFRSADVKYLDNKLLYFNTYYNEKPEPIVLVRKVFYSYKTDKIPSQLSRCVFCDASKPQCPDASSSDTCHLENNLLLGVSRKVDCMCTISGGTLGVVTETNGLLYPIWFHASCIVVVVSCSLSLLAHFFTLNAYGPMVKMLMQIIFSLLAFQLIYMLDVFLSPWVILNSPAYNCIIISVVAHLFYVSQFTWIACQAYNLYNILHLNKDMSSISFLRNFVASWGSALIFVCVFSLCSFFIYTYAMDVTFDQFYGDVTGNKDVCFMTNLYAGLMGVFLLQLIMLVAVVLFLHRTSRSLEQWKDYDDIYGDNKNSAEFILLVTLWMLLILSYFFGGLHLIIRQQWILIIFVIINTFMGVYVAIVYCLIRWFKQLQSKMRREHGQKSSELLSIKSTKKKTSNDSELAPSSNDSTDNHNPGDFEFTEVVVNLSNDAGELDYDPGSHAATGFWSPTSLKHVAKGSTTPKIQLQRANSDDSMKSISVDDTPMHFKMSLSCLVKNDFLDDIKVDGSSSASGKRDSDLSSTKSLSLEDLDKSYKNKNNIMSDIFV